MGILPPVRVEQRGGVRSEINPYDKGRDFDHKSMYSKGLGCSHIATKPVEPQRHSISKQLLKNAFQFYTIWV